MNQRSHTGWLTDMAERIAQLQRDLAAAQAKNAEDAALIVQLTNACENAETEPEWLHLALTNKEKELKDLAAAQAERDALFRSKSTLNTRVLAAETEVQALRVAHEAALKEAVATEREEILKMLDRHKANWQKSWHGQGEVYTVLAVDTIAKAIKARGAA